MQTIIYKGRKIYVGAKSFVVFGNSFKTEKGARGYIDRVDAKFTAFLNRYDLPKAGNNQS